MSIAGLNDEVKISPTRAARPAAERIFLEMHVARWMPFGMEWAEYAAFVATGT
jgi:hypothetical protein